MIQRRVVNPAEGDSAVAVFHQLGLREDCFAGLETNSSSASTNSSFLQRSATGNRHRASRGRDKSLGRLLKQEPMREGQPSRALGRDGLATLRAANSTSGMDAAVSEAEIVRRRECTVRSMAASLLGDALYQPAFEELRTKQQLGYLVFAGLTSSSTLGASEHESSVAAGTRLELPEESSSRSKEFPSSRLIRDAWTARHALEEAMTARTALTAAPRSVRGDEMMALYVIVQGPDNSPALLDVRVTQFLTHLNDTLEQLTAAPHEDGGMAASAWQGMVQAQIIAKKRKPLSLSDGTGLLWGEIAGRTFRFARRQEQLDVLEGGHIDMNDLVMLYNSRVLDFAGQASRVSIQVFGADVPIESPLDAWAKDAKRDPTAAGLLPTASGSATNVTDADPINSRLA